MTRYFFKTISAIKDGDAFDLTYTFDVEKALDAATSDRHHMTKKENARTDVYVYGYDLDKHGITQDLIADYVEEEGVPETIAITNLLDDSDIFDPDYTFEVTSASPDPAEWADFLDKLGMNKPAKESAGLDDHTFNLLFADALAADDKEDWISKWAAISLFDPDLNIDAIVRQLGPIYDAAHLTIKDIRRETGLSQAAFAERFCIPRRTVEDWESGARECRPYVRLLMARLLGLL